MTVPFKPIKATRISDQVYEQLRELIFRGELKPGEQLMPERELASALGVSRPTVREAINKLVVMGLLEHRQGQGTFVSSPASDSQNPLAAAMKAQDSTLVDLLEVRMGLECNAVALAAGRAVEKDIRMLEKSLEEMRREVRSGRLGTEEDVSFHMAVAYATQNPVQVHIMRSFYDFLFVGIKENLQHLYEDPDNIERIIEQHTSILQAIKEHNPAKAQKAMRAHIDFVLDFFRHRKTSD